MVKIYMNIFSVTSFIYFSYKSKWSSIVLMNIGFVIVIYLKEQDAAAR